MNYCMGDFGASVELTEISDKMLKPSPMGAIGDFVKDNYGTILLTATLIYLIADSLKDDLASKRK